MKLRWGTVSITGKFRENNEDHFLADSRGRYFLVADGMGGQSAGEKASELAISLIPDALDKKINFESGTPNDVVKGIDDAVSHANSEIIALGEIDPNLHNMGTTINFLIAAGERLYAGGVGDSRVYLFRDGRLDQLTTDHSLTQALLDAGTLTPEEAANHRYRNVLYRYLGTKDGGTGTAPREIEPRPGDRFLLCTDGITDGLPHEKLQQLMAADNEPQQTAEALVRAAEAGGSKDNITCIVVYVDS